MTGRVLIVIPAFNEEHSLPGVVAGLAQFAPEYDRVIVNDGSTDQTAGVIQALGERQLRLASNLGYGRALQTGMRYAVQKGYSYVVSFDADGQHRAEDVRGVMQALAEQNADLAIGSRYSDGRPYAGPLDRRIGQQLFSSLTRMLVGRRIYDTTSGFKVMRIAICQEIIGRTFMDLHIETIVRLGLLGYKIIEHPIVVLERSTGQSMHNYTSIFAYPLKTILLTLVAVIDALLIRRKA